MKNKLKYLFSLMLLAVTDLIIAQTPREIHVDNEPVNWDDPLNIAILIIAPIALLFAGFFIRNYLRKKRMNQHQS